jgi:hypothetical protein
LERLERMPNDGPHAMVRPLARVIGIGIEAADMLVQEVLSRTMRDRRAVPQCQATAAEFINGQTHERSRAVEIESPIGERTGT